MFHYLLISAGSYYYDSMIVRCCCHAVNKKRVNSKIPDSMCRARVVFHCSIHEAHLRSRASFLSVIDIEDSY